MHDTRDPVAVGLIVKTSTAVLIDAIYHNLETRQLPARRPFPPGPRPSPKTHRVHHLVPLPAAWAHGTPYARLPANAPVLDLPIHVTEPDQAQDWRGRLRLQPVYELDLDLPDTDPSIPPYDHTGSVDRAPKVLLRAPAGDFAFGTSMSVRRTLFTHSSGGGPPGTVLWGRTRSLEAADVVLPTCRTPARPRPATPTRPRSSSPPANARTSPPR